MHFLTALYRSALFLPILAATTSAQVTGPEAFSIYNTTGRLPDGCIDGYTAGRDEYLYTVPYTYEQVLSIIGSFANITWNGINSTTLNGTDNTVGTARFYTTFGIPLVETIKVYQSPPGGPYFEDHTLAPAYNPTANLSIYAPVDITTVTPVCGNTASRLNFTIEYCSTNVTGAGPILHDSHVFDAVTLQEFLGNDTWVGCENGGPTGTGVIGPTGTGSNAGPTGTGSAPGSGANGTYGAGAAGPTAAAFTGGATAMGGGAVGMLALAATALGAALLIL